MTNNYYFISTGSERKIEIFDRAEKELKSYFHGGNNMYTLRINYETNSGNIRSSHIKNLSKDLDLAKEKASKWFKENAKPNMELRLFDLLEDVEANEEKPQWFKDVEAKNKILKKQAAKEQKEREVSWALEKEQKNKKLIASLSKSNFVGQPKESLEKKLVIKNWTHKKIAAFCGYGDPDILNIITLEDEEKNVYIYFGSSDIGSKKENDFQTRDENNQLANHVSWKDRIGKTYQLKFSIKKHSIYIPKNLEGSDFKGQKQNVIQRPKVIERS